MPRAYPTLIFAVLTALSLGAAAQEATIRKNLAERLPPARTGYVSNARMDIDFW